jgi:hypothetical protein
MESALVARLRLVFVTLATLVDFVTSRSAAMTSSSFAFSTKSTTVSVI